MGIQVYIETAIGFPADIDLYNLSDENMRRDRDNLDKISEDEIINALEWKIMEGSAESKVNLSSVMESAMKDGYPKVVTYILAKSDPGIGLEELKVSDEFDYRNNELLVAIACGLKHNTTLRSLEIDYKKLSKLHLLCLLAAVVYNLRFVSETSNAAMKDYDKNPNTALYSRMKDDLLSEARQIWKPFKGQQNSEMIEDITQIFTDGDMVEGLSHETISKIQSELDKHSFRMFIRVCKFSSSEDRKKRAKVPKEK